MFGLAGISSNRFWSIKTVHAENGFVVTPPTTIWQTPKRHIKCIPLFGCVTGVPDWASTFYNRSNNYLTAVYKSFFENHKCLDALAIIGAMGLPHLKELVTWTVIVHTLVVQSVTVYSISWSAYKLEMATLTRPGTKLSLMTANIWTLVYIQPIEKFKIIHCGKKSWKQLYPHSKVR